MNYKKTKNILLTYTGGFPNSTGGGGLKIIYLLLQYHNIYINYDFFSYDFASSKINNTVGNLVYKENHSKLQKQRQKIINKSKFLNHISASQCYTELHLIKQKIRFKMYSQKNSWDIIHAHSTIAMDYFYKNKARKILSIHSKGSIIFDLQNNAQNINYSKRVINRLIKAEKRAIQNSDIITFPSLAAKTFFLEEIGEEIFKSKKVEIVYNGIEIERIKKIKENFTFKKKNHKKTVFLNIANHIKPKNIKLLVEIFNILVNKLKRKDIVLYNIGWGPQTKEIQALIYKYDLNQNFHLLGQVNNTQTIEILKTADFFISMGEKVIFDLVILEALAAGVTIIATNIGGNKEVIINNFNGYLIKIDSINEMVNFLKNVRKLDKDKIIKTAEKFSVENMVNNYTKLYYELL